MTSRGHIVISGGQPRLFRRKLKDNPAFRGFSSDVTGSHRHFRGQPPPFPAEVKDNPAFRGFYPDDSLGIQGSAPPVLTDALNDVIRGFSR